MKRKLLISAAAATLAAGIGLSVPVLAQQGQGPRHEGGMMEHHFARMCENRDAHIAGMLAYAETRLKLSDDQKPAWNKLAATVKASTKPMDDICTKLKDAPPPKTLPERLERVEQIEQARLAQLQQVRPAVADLYQVLRPEQKEIADNFMRGGPHGFMHDGPHGMRGPHGDEHHPDEHHPE
jgi:hypothetical protein